MLEVAPGGVQLGSLAVADADDEVVAHEDGDLAGLHGVTLVDVPEGLEDQEERFVVALQLRALVGVQGVLDRQGMEVEELGDPAHLGLVRLVHTDPDEVTVTSPGVPDRTEVVAAHVERDTDTVAVQRAVDDHAAQVNWVCPYSGLTGFP